jgi:NADPH:quinone reductase-like Zn-dependent oxidoreductase
MKQVVVHSAGAWDKLRVEEAPDPKPGPGEVLVRTEAAGVNFADVVVRLGLYASAKDYVGWPIVPGFEFAGRVVELGPEQPGGQESLAPGDAVFGVTRFFGYATHVVVPRQQLFGLPAGWTMARGAAFPAVHLTAWYALKELCSVRPGMSVLVHSAAGGVGSALVQLARAAGCRVLAVVGSAAKVEVARRLGADVVIDKSSEDLWKSVEAAAPAGCDVVCDANGVETLGQSYKHLAPAGRLVIYGAHTMLKRGGGKAPWLKLAWDWLRTPRFNPLDLTNDNKSLLAFNLSYLFEKTEVLQEAMGGLLGLAQEGKLLEPPCRVFALQDVAEAHKAIESGTTSGKLVLATA